MHTLQILYPSPGIPNLTCIFKDRPNLGIKYFKVKINPKMTFDSLCNIYICRYDCSRWLFFDVVEMLWKSQATIRQYHTQVFIGANLIDGFAFKRKIIKLPYDLVLLVIYQPLLSFSWHSKWGATVDSTIQVGEVVTGGPNGFRKLILGHQSVVSGLYLYLPCLHRLRHRSTLAYLLCIIWITMGL